MTKFTYFSKCVKVLRLYYSRYAYNGYCDKSVRGFKWIIGKYFVAEHSHTPGLYKGDAFTIKEYYQD